MATHGLTVDGCIAFSNPELVDRLYAAVAFLSDEYDERADELYFLVDELIERFAPDEAYAECVRGPMDAKDLESALGELRRRQAARMLRDALN
jgi:hypothetical protein